MALAMTTLPHVPESAADFSLRSDLRPGDLGRIVSLHGTVGAQEHGFDAGFEASVAGRLAEFVTSRGACDRLWLAEHGGRLVGCLAVVALSPRDAQLCWFLVHPSARGMRLGERLLGEAVAFCKGCELEYVFLWAVRADEAAVRLFRSAGFAKAGQRSGRRWGARVIEERYDLHPSRLSG
jgi:ribosomal protein S18 acetylase RimI-like enzyme